MRTTPVATIQQGKVYHIYADQLDTPRVITDENGKTLWRWNSSPFGETAANEDADGDGIALNYNPRFPGQLYDAETGLHYNYHRDYNPETGRYVQSDPIGLAGGLNTFGYAGQSPFNSIDPNGLFLQFVDDNSGIPKFIERVGPPAPPKPTPWNKVASNIAEEAWRQLDALPFGRMGKVGAVAGNGFFSTLSRLIKPTTNAAKLCFVKGTPVHTQSGLKPIEDVKVGDLVASRSDATGETTWKPVVQLFHNKDKTILKLTLTHPDGKSETLGVTPEHPFNVVNEGWVEAGKLSVGAVIHSLDGQPIRVQSVEQDAQRQDTYNFEVADYHTYFVGQNGVWVHNACTVLKRIDELIPLHSMDTIGIQSGLEKLSKLSDAELLKAVTAPLNGQMVEMHSKTGRLINGNTRVLELQRRMNLPSSSIKPSTKIPIEIFKPDDSMFLF